MTNLFQNITTAISNVVLFIAACVMAGLGFAFVGMLAMFTMLAVGVALIASPFIAAPKTDAAEEKIAA